jgi:hypothetical protein
LTIHHPARDSRSLDHRIASAGERTPFSLRAIRESKVKSRAYRLRDIVRIIASESEISVRKVRLERAAGVILLNQQESPLV